MIKNVLKEFFQNSEEVRSNALDGELKTLKTRYEEVETENKRLSARLTETEEELNKIKGDLEDAEAKVPGHACAHLYPILHEYDLYIFF